MFYNILMAETPETVVHKMLNSLKYNSSVVDIIDMMDNVADPVRKVVLFALLITRLSLI